MCSLGLNYLLQIVYSINRICYSNQLASFVNFMNIFKVVYRQANFYLRRIVIRCLCEFGRNCVFRWIYKSWIFCFFFFRVRERVSACIRRIGKVCVEFLPCINYRCIQNCIRNALIWTNHLQHFTFDFIHIIDGRWYAISQNGGWPFKGVVF